MYLTRGAKLFCTKGSHSRRLNVPKDHGARIITRDEYDGHPFVTKYDCEVGEDKNISYYGVCQCLTDNPSLMEQVDLAPMPGPAPAQNSVSMETGSSLTVCQDGLSTHWHHEGIYNAPQVIEEIVLKKEIEEGEEASEEVVVGNKCCPYIEPGHWQCTKEDSISTYHGIESLVTNKSFLRCKYGGIISVKDSNLTGIEYDGDKDSGK